MPHRINIVGDLGTTKVASDSYDIDNIYFTEEGWVYRHYKRSDKSKWWDEIIVAGQALIDAANAPITATNPAKLGLAGGTDAGGTAVDAPTFEGGPVVGDDKKDFEYSSYQSEGGGVPDFDQDGAPGVEDPTDEGGNSGNSGGGSSNPVQQPS